MTILGSHYDAKHTEIENNIATVYSLIIENHFLCSTSTEAGIVLHKINAGRSSEEKAVRLSVQNIQNSL